MRLNIIESITAALRQTIQLSLLALFLINATTLKAQFPETQAYHVDPGGHERNRNIDVLNMKVEVSFDAP